MDVRATENDGRSVCVGVGGRVTEESEPEERLRPVGKQPLSQRRHQGGVL